MRLRIRPSRQYAVSRVRAGFTLIELLAVVLIISILAVTLAPTIFSSGESVKISTTRSFLQQLTAEIEAYEREKGDFPRSVFPASLDPRPSPLNMGIEMLVISLMPADESYAPTSTMEEHLCNTDRDETKRTLTRFPKTDAFELKDAWGNPLAYMHRKSYKDGGQYMCYVDAEDADVEVTVAGEINDLTGEPYRPDSFQLISAGSDGVFGTDDDIGNFKRSK